MYLKGIFIIFSFLAIGNLLSAQIDNFLPGSVIGMVLLFLSLVLGMVRAEDVRPVANFLTKNMALFFLPAAIGLVEQWGLIRMNLLGWLVVLVVPTFCVLISVCKVQDAMMSLMNRLKERRHHG